jgi:hypothetical protein
MMSAICAHADLVDWKRRLGSDPDPEVPAWPYGILWPDQSATLVTIVPDTWTSDYTATNGFSMTLTQFPGSSATVFTFSFEEAHDGPVYAPVKDAGGNLFTLTLAVID